MIPVAKSGPHWCLQDIFNRHCGDKTDTSPTVMSEDSCCAPAAFSGPTDTTSYTLRVFKCTLHASTWICFSMPQILPIKAFACRTATENTKKPYQLKIFYFPILKLIELIANHPQCCYEIQYCFSSLCMYLWPRLH